jgi:CotH kinase protein/Chitobiase/beta-hexosaminidase C-terminal domain
MNAGPKPINVCLAAGAALTLLIALFASHPLHDSIVGQLFSLNHLRLAKLSKISTPAVRWEGGTEEPFFPQIFAGQDTAADVKGGIYDKGVRVTLASSKPARIYYTLDGSTPTARSLPYHEPISIEHTTTLRFASFSPELHPGPVESHTYIVGEAFGLPVLSLVIDPVFLWNRHSGIYFNALKRGVKWRRPTEVEYFEDKASVPMSFPAELKIHGGEWTRSLEKKSFQLSYQTTALQNHDHNAILKPLSTDHRGRTLVVRAAAVDASYRLGDELFRSLYADAGGLVSRATPAMLLINAKPWGLYNLHEKIDRAYLQRVNGAADYDFVSDAGYRDSEQGRSWNDLLDFFATRDLTDDQNLQKATRLIDVENFTDYWLFNIYAANLDWPHNNYYAFRKRADGERWRWISWDTDATFNFEKGVRHDTLSWATRGSLRHDLSYAGRERDEDGWLVSTAIIRALLTNRNYQTLFVRRFCKLHDSHFRPDRLTSRFETIVDRMKPQLTVDWARWPGSKQAYLDGVQGVRRFIGERPAIVLRQFQERFGFTECRAV